MPDLNEIGNDPGYGAKALAASKSTILIFLGVFFCLVVVSDVSPGFVGGTIFAVAGIFVVSLLISAPRFLLQQRSPPFRGLFDMLDGLVTIVATYAFYMLIFR